MNKTGTFIQRVYHVGAVFPEDTDLQLSLLGVFQSLGNFQWEQIAPIVVIHVVLEGEGTIHCNGKIFQAKRGDLFVFRKGSCYRYYDHPLNPWSYIYLALSGKKIDTYMDQVGLTTDCPVLNLSDSKQFWIRLNILKQEFADGQISGISAVRAGWEIFELLKDQYDRQGPSKKSNLAETAWQIVNSSPQTLTSVNELADMLSVCRSTLFRRFKDRYQISIKEYIEQIRFERIETMLKISSLSLGEIARTGGFNDPLYFSRVFRKRYNTTPSQWRIKNRNQRSILQH